MRNRSPYFCLLPFAFCLLPSGLLLSPAPPSCIKSKPDTGFFSHPLQPSEVASMKKAITLTVNGTTQRQEVEPRMLLVHYLRDVLGLTGTHVGCETSLCGACTILLDGQAVKSCTMLAVKADGAEITTIEGLVKNGELHPMQEGFWERHGLQCGYCTPGMILAATQIIDRNANPSREEIRHGLEGNLCRCTGYQHIVEAVEYAAKKRSA